ncbi:MAG: succinate dehydrogenase, hydrophobic membrane anchor protein [Mariprofundaceae bacterium]|nr:succinate dehydrogenase, hydrophobic membrane anchor protein [Mariprofundaceae bacterium]
MVMKKDTGTAHNGLSDWYWQRLTALLLLVIIPLPFLLLCGVYSGVLNQFALLDLLDHFLSRLFHTLLIVAIVVHAYIGLKVILEDYVRSPMLRVALIGAMLVTMSAAGIWWLALVWAWGG